MHNWFEPSCIFMNIIGQPTGDVDDQMKPFSIFLAIHVMTYVPTSSSFLCTLSYFFEFLFWTFDCQVPVCMITVQVTRTSAHHHLLSASHKPQGLISLMLALRTTSDQIATLPCMYMLLFAYVYKNRVEVFLHPKNSLPCVPSLVALALEYLLLIQSYFVVAQMTSQHHDN